MERARLAELTATILESYSAGNTTVLEPAWTDLMLEGSGMDVFLFTYSMIRISREMSGPGPFVVPLEVWAGAPGSIDIPDSAKARRMYVRLSALAARDEVAAATHLWGLLLNRDPEVLPTVASYALREAYVQAVARPRAHLN